MERKTYAFLDQDARQCLDVVPHVEKTQTEWGRIRTSSALGETSFTDMSLFQVVLFSARDHC
jgi:hypothetical protein